MGTRSISKSSLIVGEGMVIEGTIITTGSIEIRGTVKGDVSALDILVRKSGVVVGSIVTTDIIVEGQVRDKLKVTGHLEIMSSGTVSGTIEYSSIQIEKGANINGSLSRTGNSAAKPSKAAEPAAVHRLCSRPRLTPKQVRSWICDCTTNMAVQLACGTA